MRLKVFAAVAMLLFFPVAALAADGNNGKNAPAITEAQAAPMPQAQ